MGPEQRSDPASRARLALSLIIILLVAGAVLRLALAAAPPPSAEGRARALGERLACPICQGESVADSSSALASQMRAVIVEQIAAGRSDAQITQYFVDRYGPAILLTPPKQGFTLLAWWVPVLVIVVSAGGLALAALRWTRRSGGDDALPPLTADEQRRYATALAAALQEDGGERSAAPHLSPGASDPEAEPRGGQLGGAALP